MTSNLSRKPRGCFGLDFWILLVAVMLLVALLVAGNAIQRRATTADFEKFPAPGQLVGVDGHDMHIFCRGEGSPTVIAEAGNGDFSINWGLVQPEVIQLTRMCVYDRPGYGWSEPSPAPRTAQQMAAELHNLLTNAGIEGPYIMLGHSLGGLVVRMYQDRYPNEVVGMVLVDSTHEESLDRFPQEFIHVLQQQDGTRRVMQYLAQFGVFRLLGESVGERFIPEHIQRLPADQQRAYLLLTSHPDYFATSRAEMQALAESGEQISQVGNLGDLPLVVIAADQQIEGIPGDLPVEEIQATARALQEELAALSSNSTYIVAEGSGHNIHFDRPDLVVAAIQRVLE